MLHDIRMAPGLRSRNKSRLGRKTRKINDYVAQIPELKHSFDALRKGTVSIIKNNANAKERITRFKALWKDIFNLPVNAMSAEAYMRVVEKSTGAKLNKTRKATQSGGMAPLDFQTRPGIDGVHGSFPAYQSAGLSFYDTINQSAMFKGCGIENSTPAIPANMGSNAVQGGGANLTDTLFSLTTRPIDPTVPTSALQSVQNGWLGFPPAASPLANQNPLKLG